MRTSNLLPVNTKYLECASWTCRILEVLDSLFLQHHDIIGTACIKLTPLTLCAVRIIMNKGGKQGQKVYGLSRRYMKCQCCKAEHNLALSVAGIYVDPQSTPNHHLRLQPCTQGEAGSQTFSAFQFR